MALNSRRWQHIDRCAALWFIVSTRTVYANIVATAGALDNPLLSPASAPPRPLGFNTPEGIYIDGWAGSFWWWWTWANRGQGRVTGNWTTFSIQQSISIWYASNLTRLLGRRITRKFLRLEHRENFGFFVWGILPPETLNPSPSILHPHSNVRCPGVRMSAGWCPSLHLQSTFSFHFRKWLSLAFYIGILIQLLGLEPLKREAEPGSWPELRFGFLYKQKLVVFVFT